MFFFRGGGGLMSVMMLRFIPPPSTGQTAVPRMSYMIPHVQHGGLSAGFSHTDLHEQTAQRKPRQDDGLDVLEHNDMLGKIQTLQKRKRKKKTLV